MTIVVTGAGSGGHITPILAVAHELKKINPKINIVYIGQSGDNLSDVVENSTFINEIYKISAGKLRRYHKGGFRQVVDIKTMLKNTRDVFRVVLGTVQCFFILGRIKPDVVFIKGGYIGVPVGLSAAARKIPYITHDSDSIPGLANRIISPWAKVHTTGLPVEYYNYPIGNAVEVGVPVSSEFMFINNTLKNKYRSQLNLNPSQFVLLITGGGLGSQTINGALVKVLPKLLDNVPDLYVVHISGRSHESSLIKSYENVLTKNQQTRIKILGFTTELVQYSGAADLIITRAGATNLAEYAIQGKACIVVPNPHLVGGHQIKNAAALAEKDAIELIEEKDIQNQPELLYSLVKKLIDSPGVRERLGQKLHEFAHPNTARDLAKILLKNIKKG